LLLIKVITIGFSKTEKYEAGFYKVVRAFCDMLIQLFISSLIYKRTSFTLFILHEKRNE